MLSQTLNDILSSIITQMCFFPNRNIQWKNCIPGRFWWPSSVQGQQLWSMESAWSDKFWSSVWRICSLCQSDHSVAVDWKHHEWGRWVLYIVYKHSSRVRLLSIIKFIYTTITRKIVWSLAFVEVTKLNIHGKHSWWILISTLSIDHLVAHTIAKHTAHKQ